MRGTLSYPSAIRLPSGIIPAYAGNTLIIRCISTLSRDHPRVCGEHTTEPACGRWSTGSSPRMRGTRAFCKNVGIKPGIIPAYAGNTSRNSSTCSPARDHPRVCGEHAIVAARPRTRPGSSPRMRGTLVGRVMGDGPNGIIPAYAGNTLPWISAARGGRDHPRVCGEHARRLGFGRGVLGSSPRMRGTPTGYASGSTRCRIIPAYAGNTRHAVDVGQQCGDHPRVCGEHKKTMCLITLQEGSSPRMRGTLVAQFLRADQIGIIPAYAGNTFGVSRGIARARDHPRVCGEHMPQLSAMSFVVGSSPRMRGTLAICRNTIATTGIIPAYAGNTR